MIVVCGSLFAICCLVGVSLFVVRCLLFFVLVFVARCYLGCVCCLLIGLYCSCSVVARRLLLPVGRC